MVITASRPRVTSRLEWEGVGVAFTTWRESFNLGTSLRCSHQTPVGGGIRSGSPFVRKIKAKTC
ncbi:hypothetical protein M378DRAFT_171982, partial [Amanita muscaria Koide BX008]